jgi:hypothetical protein
MDRDTIDCCRNSVSEAFSKLDTRSSRKKIDAQRRHAHANDLFRLEKQVRWHGFGRKAKLVNARASAAALAGLTATQTSISPVARGYP